MNGTSVLIKSTPESWPPCEDAGGSASASGRLFSMPCAHSTLTSGPGLQSREKEPVLCVSPGLGYFVTAAQAD